MMIGRCVPSRMGRYVYVVCVGLLYAVSMAWSMMLRVCLLGCTSLARMGSPLVSVMLMVMVCSFFDIGGLCGCRRRMWNSEECGFVAVDIREELVDGVVGGILVSAGLIRFGIGLPRYEVIDFSLRASML